MITAASDAIAETLYPTRCIGCDEPGWLVCPHCDEHLERIDLNRACKRCGAAYGSLACTECTAPGELDASGSVVEPPFIFDAARCACSYDGAASGIIRAYKDNDERRLAPYIANEMLRATKGSSELEDWGRSASAIIAVPPTAQNARKRGWEHMAPIARLVAEGTHLPVINALQSSNAADQRQLGRKERAANRRKSIGLAPTAGKLPRTVILLDDVLTTGATCDAAAFALKSACVERVLVVTFARVW